MVEFPHGLGVALGEHGPHVASTAPFFCLVVALPAALRIKMRDAAPPRDAREDLPDRALEAPWASLVTQITPPTPCARSDSGNDFRPSKD